MVQLFKKKEKSYLLPWFFFFIFHATIAGIVKIYPFVVIKVYESNLILFEPINAQLSDCLLLIVFFHKIYLLCFLIFFIFIIYIYYSL